MVWAADEQGHQVLARYAGASAAPSATPHIDALDRAMYGPSREERWREEDAKIEAELMAEMEAERLAAASNALTDDEYRRLFPDES